MSHNFNVSYDDNDNNLNGSDDGYYGNNDHDKLPTKRTRKLDNENDKTLYFSPCYLFLPPNLPRPILSYKCILNIHYSFDIAVIILFIDIMMHPFISGEYFLIGRSVIMMVSSVLLCSSTLLLYIINYSSFPLLSPCYLSINFYQIW